MGVCDKLYVAFFDVSFWSFYLEKVLIRLR